MWQKIVAYAQEFIKLAEGFKDKTGVEKRAYVVKKMCEVINIPFVPDWIENLFEPMVYGFVVDTIVKWWNVLTGRKLETIPDNPETAAVMAEVVAAEVKSVASLAVVSQEDVEAKFQSLLVKYGSV